MKQLKIVITFEMAKGFFVNFQSSGSFLDIDILIEELQKISRLEKYFLKVDFFNFSGWIQVL